MVRQAVLGALVAAALAGCGSGADTQGAQSTTSQAPTQRTTTPLATRATTVRTSATPTPSPTPTPDAIEACARLFAADPDVSGTFFFGRAADLANRIAAVRTASDYPKMIELQSVILLFKDAMTVAPPRLSAAIGKIIEPLQDLYDALRAKENVSLKLSLITDGSAIILDACAGSGFNVPRHAKSADYTASVRFISLIAAEYPDEDNFSSEDLVDIGGAVCAAFGRGGEYKEVQDAAFDDGNTFSFKQAVSLIVGATYIYCPTYISKLPA